MNKKSYEQLERENFNLRAALQGIADSRLDDIDWLEINSERYVVLYWRVKASACIALGLQV